MALLESLRDFASLDGKAAGTLDAIPGPRDYAPEVFGTTLTSSNNGSRFAAGNAKRQLEAYGSGGERAIDWVADAMGIIAETGAHAEWHLEDYEGTPTPAHRAEAEPNARLANQWLVQLLEEPNPYQTWDQLMELYLIDR